MITIEEAGVLHGIIEEAMETAGDETALKQPSFTKEWLPAIPYAAGARVRFGDTLYRCLAAHTAQETWTPTDAPSLWAKVLIPDAGTVFDWEQPGSTNPYRMGDRVLYSGRVWVSTIDDNIWEPGVYGWEPA